MGVVVIGQSPRPSIAAEIAAVLSPGLAIELRGALDGMSRAEIDAIPPRDGPDALFTLLPNGDSVTHQQEGGRGRAALQLARFRQEGVERLDARLHRQISQSRAGWPGDPAIRRAAPYGRGGFARGDGSASSRRCRTDRADRQKWQRDGVEVIGVTLQPGSDAAASTRRHGRWRTSTRTSS